MDCTTTGDEFYLCPFGIQEQCDALAVSAETSEHVYFAVKQSKHRRAVIKNRRLCVLMTSLLYTTCPNDAMDDTISTRERKIFWGSLVYFFEVTEFLYQSGHSFSLNVIGNRTPSYITDSFHLFQDLPWFLLPFGLHCGYVSLSFHLPFSSDDLGIYIGSDLLLYSNFIVFIVRPLLLLFLLLLVLLLLLSLPYDWKLNHFCQGFSSYALC